MKELAEKIIQNDGLNAFTAFFQESQYLIQLWTAHLLLTFETSQEIRNISLVMIKKYTDNPLAPKVAAAEAIWLNKFYPNFKE